MAIKIFNYCIGKPYFKGKLQKNDVRPLVKKSALNFALDNGEDIAEAMNAVDEVTAMLLKRTNQVLMEMR